MIELLENRFLMSVSQVGGEFRVNTTTSNNMEAGVAVAMDDAGDSVVAFASKSSGNYDIYFQRYNSAGVPQGSETQVNTTTAGDQRNPDVAMDDDGDFIVTWWFKDTTTSKYEIFARRYTAAGAANGGEFRVNTTISTAIRKNPRVAVDSTSDIVVFAWESAESGTADVYARRYNALTNTFPDAADFRINATTTLIQRDVDVAMNSDGTQVLFAWESDQVSSGSFDIYGRRYNASTGSFPATEFVVSNAANSQVNPAVSMDTVGDHAVFAYTNGQSGNNDIYVHRYDAVAGSFLAAESVVNTTTTGAQIDVDVAVDNNGDFSVVWSTDQGGTTDIYVRQYDSAGTAQTGETLVNTTTATNQDNPAVATPTNKDLFVVWSGNVPGDSTGVAGQLYRRDPVVDGTEFRVNTSTTGVQRTSSVATDDSGNFVVAWQSRHSGSYHVYFQRYNASGVAQGSETIANTTMTGNQFFPSVARDDDGDFVVSWTSDQTGNYDVYFQRYNSSGVAQGSETRANTTTANNQMASSIALDATGDFVITWSSFSQDAAGTYGIYFQRYNSAGTAQGSETRANTTTVGDQKTASIAMESNGDFAITWSSDYVNSDNWWNTQWLKRSKFTFDNSGQSENLINFTTLVSLNATNLIGLNLGAVAGADVRFVDGTTGAVLKYEVETWNAGSDTANVWVNVPQIDGSSNSDSIWVYYDYNGTATYDQTAADEDATWNSAYEGVWHLNEGTGVTAADSTSNANSAVPTGANPTTAAGQIGSALTFANPQQLVIAASASLDLTTYSDWTMSAWVKPTSYNVANKWPCIYAYGSYRASLGLTVQQGTDGLIENWTNDATLRQSTTAATLNAWHYVTVSRTATTTSFYLDGNADGSGTSTTVTTAGQASNIGDIAGLVADQFIGLIDEVRVSGLNGSDGSRSANWVKAEYLSMTGAFGSFSDPNIYFQRYTAAGAAVGANIQVTTLTSVQVDPKIAMDYDGDFVVTWDDKQGGTYDVYARLYDNAGTAKGAEFRVNTTTANSQFFSSVSMDDDGDFVVAWMSAGQDNADGSYGIYAQRYSATGSARGSEFKVNTTTAKAQVVPSVATDFDGDFIVAWDSKDQDASNYGVYAQRYTAAAVASLPLEVASRTAPLPPIGLKSAHALVTNAASVTVASLDTGVDYTHPELYRNIWLNQREIPRALRRRIVDSDGDGRISWLDLNDPRNHARVTDWNANGYIDAGDLLRSAADGGWSDGIDNDRNGYVDDLVGWDFAQGDNDPFDDNGHGTHGAGVVLQVAPNTQIMPLKFLDQDGTGLMPSAVAALDYALAQRARISTGAWNTKGSSPEWIDALQRAQARGHMFIAAAGNGDPALLESVAAVHRDNVLTVTASDAQDRLASFSNSDPGVVDLAAPGTGVTSTRAGGGHEARDGTSVSVGFVAGTASLLWGAHPNLHYREVVDAILASADPINDLLSATAHGRLNVHDALITADQLDKIRTPSGDNNHSGGGRPNHHHGENCAFPSARAIQKALADRHLSLCHN